MESILLSYLSMTSVLCLALVALMGYFLLSWCFDKTPKNVPPGPRDWSTVWQLLKASFRDGTLHELAWKWAELYGPLVYLESMGQKMLFVNSCDAARRLLNDDETKMVVADRVPSEVTKMVWFGNKDFLFAKFDTLAKKKRKIFFSLLHMYGDGVERFDEIVNEQIQILFKELEQHENKDFELWKPLARSIKSVVCIMALGEHPNKETADNLEAFDIAFNKLLDSGMDMLITAFPVLSKIPCRIKTAVDKMKTAKALAEKHIFHIPKKTYVPGKPRGTLDLLLDIQRQPGNEWLDDETVISFLTSKFWAAHVTSRSSLLAAFLCFINYPKVAKNIQEEIDRVIGDQQPRVEFRSNMPYTEAFMLELLRVLSQVPLSALRHTRSDIQFEGWTIPKGTMIQVNNWYFHRDEKIWDDPWELKVERFLDENGQVLPADSPARRNILPFGIGARSCPGEVFAKCRIFLIVTSILQKYDVLPPANEPTVPADFRTNYEGVKGFVRQVQPYKVHLRPRQTEHTLTQSEA